MSSRTARRKELSTRLSSVNSSLELCSWLLKRRTTLCTSQWRELSTCGKRGKYLNQTSSYGSSPYWVSDSHIEFLMTGGVQIFLPYLPPVAGTLKPHRRTKSESDVKRSNGKRSKPDKRTEKRRDSEEDPPNDKTPPEVGRKGRRQVIIGRGLFCSLKS